MTDIVVRVSEATIVQARVARTAATATLRVGGGVRGPAGTAAGFNFTQASPANEWIMNHNLGYKPAIDLFTVGGVQFVAEIVHIDDNQARAYLITPLAGSARLS